MGKNVHPYLTKNMEGTTTTIILLAAIIETAGQERTLELLLSHPHQIMSLEWSLKDVEYLW